MNDHCHQPNRRILIIDDNPAIHEDFRKIFCRNIRTNQDWDDAAAILLGEIVETTEKTSFRIDSAYQGAEGLALVEKALKEDQPYAMAFVDVRMPPGWDGIETITRIWAVYPELQVVLCTAYADYSWEEMVKRIGESDNLVILKKPFDNIEALQFAHSLTQKWSIGRQLQSRLQTLDQMVLERTQELQQTNQKLTLEIQERTRTEEALRQSQKMEAVGQLAAGIAHDFNNLLTVIQGHASLRMADVPEGTGIQRSLKDILRATESASALTRGLLTFSRRQVLQCKPVQLNAVISKVCSMLRRTIGEHIRLDLDCASELAPIFADACSMEQVIMNLCVNARDAMPRGGRLTVTTTAVELTAEHVARISETSAGSFVCLSVADTGCGMDQATQERIFEPFFTTKEVGKGTGLGLATVYGIIKQHNGWIEVNSAIGQGTTFKIFLPIFNGAIPTPPEASPTLETEMPTGSETILVVEDDLALSQLVRAVLQGCGYRVLLAHDGLEALCIWEHHAQRIAILLTDMVMPNGLSGKELARRLTAERPDLKVIYTSGYSLDLLGQEFSTKQGPTILTKPYRSQDLAQTVRRCLNGSSDGGRPLEHAALVG